MKRKRLLTVAILLHMGVGLGAPSNLYAQGVDYVEKAVEGAIFIYADGTQPCSPPPSGQILLPLGSGFVTGITSKHATKEQWRGWKLLITASHVIGNRDSVILRLNRAESAGFECFPLTLVRDGESRNVIAPDETGVDLLAVYLPNIPGTDPTVFGYDLILGQDKLDRLKVRAGTGVFTVGYVFGYSGQEQNYPVTRFGRVALLTNEAWYKSERNLLERAYLVEIFATRGLSGAPVMLESLQLRVDDRNVLQHRHLAPFILGVIKGHLTYPLDANTKAPQGLAAIEPGSELRKLLEKIAERLRSTGAEVVLEPNEDQ